MRFPRNTKIFRGQVDMVPLVGVLFLLLIFILLSSLVYTPGIPFALEGELTMSGTERRTLTIARSGEIIFNERTNRITEMEALRTEFRKLPPHSVVVVHADAEAPRQVAVEVRNAARGLAITLETSSVPIVLPPAEAVIGTPNPTVSVAVNMGGQFFYENRIISGADLQKRLSNIVVKTSQPLTLLVSADESVEYRVMVQLAEIARQAGISDWLQVTRPPAQK
ncbi:MAG: biopolymer transporter ExbD [Verrucomicrobia bacterium]|nr:biopolymer transporter ExbD [Verrucomicrobiota bacterium]